MKAKYFILSILALSLIACEKDFFETESPSAMDEAVFKSADLTQQAIGAIYNTFGEDKSFRNRLCGGYVAMNTDIEHASKTEDAEYAAYNMTGGTGNLSTSNGKDPWAYLNSAIERANVVIDGIRQHSDTTDETFKYLLGEALTLRAFCYLEMVKLWGDVPASFESFNGYNSEVLYTKKQPRSVVYEQLRKDLKEAAELMPWSAQCPGMAANYTGRPSKALALGLLARMDLMYAGKAMRPNTFVEGGTKDCSIGYLVEDASKRQELYQEVVWACAQVIKQEDWKFKDNFEDIFKDLCTDVTDYSKSEWIWALPFLDGARGQVLALTGNKISTNCAGALVNTISYGSGNTNNTKTQAMIEIVPTFYYAYDKADKRRDVTILPWTWEYDDGSGTAPSGYVDVTFPGVPTTDKKIYQKQSNIGQMYCGKLRIEWMTRSYSSNEDCIDMPVLRYTDILMMFAEAAIGSKEGNKPSELYGISAKDCLDKVRARAGLASVPVTIENIIDERAFEFCGENLRKYDLMRWGILKEKLEKAQADSYDLQNNTGDFAGRPDSVWFHYTRNDDYAQNGAAYVFDKFVGLDKDATRPAEFDKENGWVAKSFFDKEEVPFLTPDKWYIYKEGTDIDMHQYWPIFDVNIAASNGTLWNDYLY